MKTVAARQELRRFPRRVKGFKADRAVRQGRVGRTRVSVEGHRLDTRPALVAVRVGFLSAHTANAALVAVILSLVYVVKKHANGHQ
jgi:hypothetical protein